VSAKELKALKALAVVLTGLSAEDLKTATSAGELVELEIERDGGAQAQG
jgi:hypothetical protein